MPSDSAAPAPVALTAAIGQMSAWLANHPAVLAGGGPPRLDVDAPDQPAWAQLTQAVAGVTEMLRLASVTADSLRNGLALFDDDLRLRYANAPFREFLGTRLLCEPGLPLMTIVDTVLRHDLARPDPARQEAWLQQLREGRDCVMRLTTRSGTVLRWSLTAARGGGYIAQAHDVTRKLRHNRRLAAARRNEARANAARVAFFAHMSHELRTPIAGIVGMADLLNETLSDPDARGCATTIRNSGEALLALVNDILDYARGKANAFSINPAPFAVTALAQDVIALLSRAATARGITLTHRIDPHLPAQMIGDAARIRQIMVNLLGNAVKFTSAGAVTLHLQPGRGGRGLNLMVEDSGPGIPEDKLDDIFRDFIQIGPGQGGSGLGLPISSQLTRAMGSDLWVCNRPEGGIVFGCWLDLQPAPATQVVASDAGAVDTALSGGACAAAADGNGDPATLAPADANTGGRRVLVADDNATNRLLISRMLRDQPVDLLFAADGQDAVTQWRHYRPDLVLMDISMPVMSGIDATRAIRRIEAQEARPPTPVVATTAYTEDGKRVEIMTAGATDLLSKPFRRAQLLALLADHVPKAAGGAGAHKSPLCNVTPTG